MSVTSNLSNDGQHLTVSVSGRFDFRVYEPFRAAYSDVSPNGVNYTVDLTNADYMDSSALGMLLLLKEHASGRNIDIVHSKPDVRNVLTIANFDKLFNIQ